MPKWFQFGVMPAVALLLSSVCAAAGPASVAARHVFYNCSAFDGSDPAANAADDGAIAPDKSALLPGQSASLANYTSYSRGINGIMIDVAGLTTSPTAADFLFRMGNDANASAWPAAPAPIAVAVRSGAGEGGSTRVTLIWPDNAIEQQWLQVTVLSGAHGGHLGLSVDDVFCFGNAIGDTGNSPTDAKVTPADSVLVRNSPHTKADPATISDPCDFDRDGRVSPTDYIIARNRGTSSLTALRLISPGSAGRTWYVHDVTDPLEDGSEAHPFDHIQEAINHTSQGDTVIVLPGTYPEAIRFPGYDITVRSTNPTDPAVVAATIIGDRDYFIEHNSAAIIVDNTDPGFSTTGTWHTVSTGDSYGGTSVWTDEVGATATWATDILYNYTCLVWVRWSQIQSGQDLDSHAEYGAWDYGPWIYSQYTADQDVGAGNWQYVFDLLIFDGPETVSIDLHRDAVDGLATSADAVMFLPIPDGLYTLPAVIQLASTESEATVLAGLTITGGGDGITGNGTRATIEHNRIINNGAQWGDPLNDIGCIGIGIDGCDGPILYNRILNNRAGGIYDCDGRIAHNLISGNGMSEDHGSSGIGGLAGCDGLIEMNVISDNSGGGGLINCNGVIRGNAIVSNQAGSFSQNWDTYGLGADNCSATFDQNLITNMVSSCHGTFTNCTLRSPSFESTFLSTYDGVIDGTAATFVNCAIDGTAMESPSSTFRNCVLFDSGGYAPGWNSITFIDGGGNIDADPRFVDIADPDGPDDAWLTSDDGLRLQAGSPCIDAADGAAASPTDILGRPRFDDPATPNTGTGTPPYADIGAYEFGGTP